MSIINALPLEFETEPSSGDGFSQLPSFVANTPFNTRYCIFYSHPAETELECVFGEYLNWDSLVRKYGDPSEAGWGREHYWEVTHTGEDVDVEVASGLSKLQAFVAAKRDFEARTLACLVVRNAA